MSTAKKKKKKRATGVAKKKNSRRTTKKVTRVAKKKKKTSPPASGPTLAKGDVPPKDVTRDLFLVWRTPRLGMSNPQRLTNSVWAWLARRKVNAYLANRHFGGPSSMAVGPCFCVSRFGQSVSQLADGRVVAIGGEHEDYYDPDFFIYNDVIVTGASGDVTIFGYPHEIFPPTDFHTATVVGDRILVIGRLGYPRQRVPATTPVSVVDLDSFAIAPLITSGECPGWIFKHEAELSPDARTITVRGGERATRVNDVEEHRDNIDDWSLDVESLVWTRLTDRRWPEWELARADGTRNHLWEIGNMAWHVGGRSDYDRQQLAKQEKKLGFRPDFDVFAARYSPPIPHAAVKEEEARYDTTLIVVDGVSVQYVEDMRAVRVTVRGSLPEEAVATLVEDARAKLEALERVPWAARQLPG
jgi:hypothetical protein